MQFQIYYAKNKDSVSMLNALPLLVYIIRVVLGPYCKGTHSRYTDSLYNNERQFCEVVTI